MTPEQNYLKIFLLFCAIKLFYVSCGENKRVYICVEFLDLKWFVDISSTQ